MRILIGPFSGEQHVLFSSPYPLYNASKLLQIQIDIGHPCDEPLRGLLVLFAVVALFSMVLFLTVPRYVTLSQGETATGDLRWVSHVGDRDSSAFTVVEKENGFLLRAAVPGSVSVYQSFGNSLAGKTVEVSARIGANGVVAGSKNWEKGRLILVQYTGGQPDWKAQHTVEALEGTQSLHGVKKVFKIGSGIDEVRLIGQLSKCAGEFEVEDIVLQVLIPNQTFGMLVWLLRIVWAIFFLYWLKVCLARDGSWMNPALLLFVLAIIVAATVMPGEGKEHVFGLFRQVVGSFAGDFIEVVDGKYYFGGSPLLLHPSKFAHIFMFFVLAVLLGRMKSPWSFCTALILVGMVACGTEILQLFSEGRGPSIFDVTIDMGGAAIGMVVPRRKLKM